MKLRESFALDAIIKERAASLSRPDLQNDSDELAKRAKVLAALIKCREKIDDIMLWISPASDVGVTNVGEVNIKLDGSGPKVYQPFDGGDLASSIRKELQRATSG